LYDYRNDPETLDDMVAVELEMIKLNKEEQVNLLKGLFGRW